MTSPINGSRGRRGFTLLEVLIVLSIVAVLAGTSVPMFRRTFNGLQLEVFSYDLSRLLEYAGRRAVATGALMRVHFAAGGRQYWLLQRDEISPGPGSGPGLESQFQRVPSRYGQTHAVPETVTLVPGASDVTFYPDGRADAFEALILDHQREGYRLTTHVWTGRVSLAKTHGT